jgi:hydrogenase maturation protein HypF
LSGFVYNSSVGVILELEGKVKDIELFDERFLDELPPLAHVDSFEKHPIALENSQDFQIIQTSSNDLKTTLISPDIKVCDQCLEDIKTTSKYQNYFATNCTNCGPRYSIINTVPYDRKNTSMQKFHMCDSCQKEYNDPTNRRYHAQPISCNDCGPTLTIYQNKTPRTSTNPYQAIASFIKEGKILAIKGIGGFHIVCDANNDNTIQALREYKTRPSKPFALMCKDLDQVQQIATTNTVEEKLLSSKEAPIVILDKKKTDIISDLVAPNIYKIGCMLPYSPLHYLLFEYLETPLIATSANLGGMPIIKEKEKIEQYLPFIDIVIDFNRDIINAVDDSIIQVIDTKPSVLRLARGYAPKVIKLPFTIDQKILAVGANSKSTIALAFEDTMILSPYIGNLDHIESFEYFIRTIETFKRFYNFEPDIIVHDMHPNYETTKWAKTQNTKLVEVQHHLAHIYALKAEYNLQNQSYIGFSFDGTGYGLDKTLWGGEIFINDKRIYSFHPISLLGGAKAIKEPRRVALATLFENYSLDELKQIQLPTLEAFSDSELQLLYQSYTKKINTYTTSSVGRLFDAIASFAGLIQTISYEGESGLLIEANYDPSISKSFEYSIENEIIKIDFVEYIIQNNTTPVQLCSMLLNTLANIVIDISKSYDVPVLLSGGVFQNKTLLNIILPQLNENQKKYYLPHTIPTNDSGISLGQLYKTILEIHNDS